MQRKILYGLCGRSCTAAALMLIIAPVAPAFAADPPWKPVKPVELVAINAPGGGSDRILRLMVKVFQDQKAMDVPVTVVNKPGGGGAMAYNYITQQADPHYLTLANKSMLTNNIAGIGWNSFAVKA